MLDKVVSGTIIAGLLAGVAPMYSAGAGVAYPDYYEHLLEVESAVERVEEEEKEHPAFYGDADGEGNGEPDGPYAYGGDHATSFDDFERESHVHAYYIPVVEECVEELDEGPTYTTPEDEDEYEETIYYNLDGETRDTEDEFDPYYVYEGSEDDDPADNILVAIEPDFVAEWRQQPGFIEGSVSHRYEERFNREVRVWSAQFRVRSEVQPTLPDHIREDWEGRPGFVDILESDNGETITWTARFRNISSEFLNEDGTYREPANVAAWRNDPRLVPDSIRPERRGDTIVWTAAFRTTDPTQAPANANPTPIPGRDTWWGTGNPPAGYQPTGQSRLVTPGDVLDWREDANWISDFRNDDGTYTVTFGAPSVPAGVTGATQMPLGVSPDGTTYWRGASLRAGQIVTDADGNAFMLRERPQTDAEASIPIPAATLAAFREIPGFIEGSITSRIVRDADGRAIDQVWTARFENHVVPEDASPLSTPERINHQTPAFIRRATGSDQGMITPTGAASRAAILRLPETVDGRLVSTAVQGGLTWTMTRGGPASIDPNNHFPATAGIPSWVYTMDYREWTGPGGALNPPRNPADGLLTWANPGGGAPGWVSIRPATGSTTARNNAGRARLNQLMGQLTPAVGGSTLPGAQPASQVTLRHNGSTNQFVTITRRPDVNGQFRAEGFKWTQHPNQYTAHRYSWTQEVTREVPPVFEAVRYEWTRTTPADVEREYEAVEFIWHVGTISRVAWTVTTDNHGAFVNWTLQARERTEHLHGINNDVPEIDWEEEEPPVYGYVTPDNELLEVDWENEEPPVYGYVTPDNELLEVDWDEVEPPVYGYATPDNELLEVDVPEYEYDDIVVEGMTPMLPPVQQPPAQQPPAQQPPAYSPGGGRTPGAGVGTAVPNLPPTLTQTGAGSLAVGLGAAALAAGGAGLAFKRRKPEDSADEVATTDQP